MQVGDLFELKTKYNYKNTYEAIIPINILLKIFGLNCVLPQQHKRRLDVLITNIKNVLTISLFGAVTFFTLYYKIRYLYVLIGTSIKYTDAVQVTFDYFQYVVDMYFVYKYGREIFLEYLKQYGKIDKILGVTYVLDLRKRLLKLIVFFVTIWLTSSMLDFVAWSLAYGLLIPVVYMMSYIYFFIKILTMLDLTSHVMQIEYRFKVMGDLMQDSYNFARSATNEDSSFSIYKDLQDQGYGGPKLIGFLDGYIKQVPRNKNLDYLSKCYLLIVEQVAYINCMFGMRILLNSLSLLIDMIRFTNIAVRYVIGLQLTTYNSGYYPALSTVVRLLTCIATISSLVLHCERVYCQRRRIINIIDHLLINKNPNEKLRQNVVELRGLLESRPIYFHMAHFLCLNYSLLVSYSSVVSTYTIILLQSMN